MSKKICNNTKVCIQFMMGYRNKWYILMGINTYIRKE
jgi:hypothetical protein